MMNAPPPFPQSAQYKKDDDDAQSTAEGETGKPCKQKKRVKKAKKRSCPSEQESQGCRGASCVSVCSGERG